MNSEFTRKSALDLEAILKKYESSHEDSRTVLNGLQSLIDDAKNGEVIIPTFVPFGYAITEGLIKLPQDAEAAYSKFSLLLTHGEEKYKDLIKWAEERKQKIFGNGNDV
tara:strand:+ start:57 stop:383 length:327 start_codon:yes stop_codon:yes gene_type:complete